MEAGLFHAYERSDSHYGTNTRFSEICLVPDKVHSVNCSMKQGHSWEANKCSASQEIPLIVRNSKVQCSSHKWPTPVPILSQLHPVHAPNPNPWISILPYTGSSYSMYQIPCYIFVAPKYQSRFEAYSLIVSQHNSFLGGGVVST